MRVKGEVKSRKGKANVPEVKLKVESVSLAFSGSMEFFKEIAFSQ